MDVMVDLDDLLGSEIGHLIDPFRVRWGIFPDGQLDRRPILARVPVNTSFAPGANRRRASMITAVPLMLNSMSGNGSLKLMMCDTWPARWKT